MAKKKKKEVETGRILGRLNDDGSITPFIQKQQEEDIAPVRNDNKWFKSGIDTSGYDIQNPLDAINRFNASVLMTGVDIIGQVGLGVTKPIEGVGDFAQNRVADVLDFFGGDKTAEKIRKSAAKEWGVNRELEQSLARDNDRGIDDMSFLGTKGKSIPQGVGSVLLAMGSGGLGGAIGGTNAAASVASLGIMGVGSAGNAEQEALEQGATRGEARLYGILSGASETLSEMMFGGLSKGSQVLGIGTGMFDSADDALINSLTKKINNKLVKTFTQAGLKATSEGIEEVVSGLGSAWAKKLTYMKEEDIKKLIEDENLLDSFLSGTLSAAVSQAPNVAQNITTRQDGKLRLQSNNEIRDFITNLNEQEQQVVEREIENRLGQEEKVTKKRRIEIEKQVIEDLDRGYINANTIRDTLGENYNAERDVRLNESFNEETRRTQAYENDLSKYDEKQRKTIQTAIDSGLLNNSNKTHDFVDLIAKLSADKGIDFDFTNNERIKDTGFAVEGKMVNGFIKDGKVTLNLESNQALNKTVGHEITHVLEGTDLYNNLQDSLKSFIGEREWNNRISELEKTYKDVKGANIENELTSDLVGEYVFNDESFVKSLSTKNPNLFQKIFDEIKYMVKIATAGSKEARDLEKVKRAFEKAYRETSKTQQGTQYSVEGKEEISLSYAKQRFNRNMGKYSIGDNLEDAYLEHQLRKDELDKLYEYAKKKAYNDSELRELERRYNELKERDNPNQADAKYSLTTDNQNNENEKITLADGRTYNNYYEYAKDITKNKDELAKELLFKHYSQNFDVPANSNETKFYHGTDATFDYDGLKVMDFDEQTMDRNYGDYFYITTDKDFSHTYGSQIAEFIIPNDKILSLEDYRQNYSNKTDDELFNDYWALEMPDNEYIVKDIKPIIDYSKQRANEYINQQENTKYSLTDEKINNLLLTNSDVYDMVNSSTLRDNGLTVEDLTSRGLDDIDKLEDAWRKANYENSSKDFHEVPIEEAVSTIRNNNAFWRLSEGWFRGADSAYKPNMEKVIIMNPELRNAGMNIAYQNYKDYIDKNISFNDFINKEIPLYRGSNDNGFVDADKFIAFSYRKDMVEKHFANRNKEIPISEIKVKIKDTLGSYQTTGEAEVLVPRSIVDKNDIRYSLSDNGEMVDNSTGEKVTLEASEEGNSGTLMVLHNLGESKINGILDLDGIPVPSIAVTNPNIIDHNQFGEGTLIFDKSTIDPAIEANEVYDRDVWTPTFKDNVQVDYEINDDAIETTAEKLGIEGWRLRDAVEDNNPEYLAERLLREEKLIDKYVADNNIKYETAYKDAETSVDMHQSGGNLRQFIRDNDLTVEKLCKDNNLKQKYFDEIKKYYDESSFPQAVKENLYKEKIDYLNNWIDSQHGMDINSIDDIPRGLRKYQRDFDLIKSGDNKVIDEWQTEKNKKQAAIDNGIEDYLKEQTKDVYGEKGIRNDVELFTNSGSRRKFWALHDEYNLDNLVEALTKGETTGTQHFGSGYGQIQAVMANRFNSIGDIKANENLLTDLSENNEVLENAKAKIDSDIEEIESNNDVYYDTVASLLTDFARGDLTVDNFKKLTRNDYQTIRNVSDSLIEKIIDDMNSLKNLPTDYFEAKPQRAVGLDEIQMAVIPNNWSQETKQRLIDKGIKFTEYNPEIEGDRQRVINQFDDLKFSLSQDNIAPTSGWNVRSEDVRLQSAFKDAIAPIQEQVQQLTDTITRLEDRIAPLNEQEADELYQETQEAFNNEVAPIRENLTPEENQRMDMLELLERNNMMNDERRYEKEQLENKINPVYPTEEATPGQALSDIRDIDEVGKRDVKAYQYEHPEVKPYFQEEARGMLNDLNNSIKGERFINESQQRGQGTSYDVIGVKRFTSPEIAELLDSKYGYTYDDIRKGLNAIIEDHGAENIAIAKRIELVLDDNLRNGYTDWQTGTEIPPNQEYLNMLAEQEWQNYFDDINSQYPLDVNQVQYALEQERQQEEQYKIEKSLEEMTADDINLEPFLSGLQGASERQAERQQLREELNQKREVKIPKQSDGRKAWNRFKSLVSNEFAVLDDYSKQTGNKDIKFKTDTYNNYQAIAQSNIETAQTDINGKAIGRSGSSIFEEAKKLGLENTFDEYLKQWANVDRAKQGKGVANYSAKESYKIVKEMETKYPVLKRLGNDMWQYYRNARHNLRDAGIINQDVSDMLGRMYPHYTPYISENIENYFTDEGKLKPKATIKRAKGGAAIGSLLSAEEAMQRYTKSEFNTIFGNDLFKEIVKTSNDIVQLGGDDRGMQFVNADNLYADKDGYYLTAYENGEPITARINEDMYRTLTRESRNRISDIENTFSAVTKPLQGLSKLRRNILTSWSPTFFVKNALKDIQEGVFNSKYTKDFIKNYPSAFKELASNTELAQQFKSLYGSGLTMGQYDIDSTNYTPSGKNKTFLQNVKNLIPSINEIVELAPRYAEFKASIDHGASLQEAMYNAREVTTNFSRGGTLAKAINRNGFTFLNSSIQGFDKFIRNFSGENGAKGIVNSLAKAAIFGIAPAVFNELAFGSGDDKDEEYEALPDYIKDNYYIIKTGDGNFIRIPKGRVLSVFGSAARRTIEAMEGEENAFEGYWNNVQQQIGINNPEENNIFAPLIQAMGGRKLDSGQTAGEAWYGGDIIPSRLQKERPEDQYDASIDKLSIWLGQHTGISPYKINYVLDQYTGGIGDIGLPMITEEANSDGSIIAPIKDQFTADTITDNKYVSEFYDTKGKLYTGSKATDEDVLKNKYMNSISTEMAKLYAERRDIQADDSLTKQQKYAKSQAIKAEINRLAKEGLDNYENIITSNNYAKIGDTEYYKNANGQWTKVTDDVASLGLDTEEKNEYYKVKNDIYTTKKENDGNDKPLVMQDIINSNLTPDAKVNLYISNYKDDLIQPLVDSGMDVDSYLTYKSQNFTADKDSNGKSISGSKKQKVFDYINSMDVPYEQKLILAKSEYNSFNDNNAEIIEYIENTGMDYDERIELYKALGFKVDGDSISW